jgi:hypothetical protein
MIIDDCRFGFSFLCICSVFWDRNGMHVEH